MAWKLIGRIETEGSVSDVKLTLTGLAIRSSALLGWNAIGGDIDWKQPIEESHFGAQPLVVVGGLVVTLAASDPSGSCRLLAFDSRSGTPKWQIILDLVPSIHPLATSRDKLFLVGSTEVGSRMIEIDAEQGQVLSEHECEPVRGIWASSEGLVQHLDYEGLMLECPSGWERIRLGTANGDLRTSGANIYCTASIAYDLKAWRIVWWDHVDIAEKGRAELGKCGASPILAPSSNHSRICAKGEDYVEVWDLSSSRRAWRTERLEVWDAAWTPYGWAVGYWDERPIEFFDDRSGESLGTLGIEEDRPEAKFWWLENRLIVTSPPDLLTYIWES